MGRPRALSRFAAVLVLSLSTGRAVCHAHGGGPGGGGGRPGGGGEGRGHGGGQRGDHPGGRFDNIARGNSGLNPGLRAPMLGRLAPLGPIGEDLFLIGLEKYLMKGAPVQTDADLHYIQNHLVNGSGPFAAPDGALLAAAALPETRVSMDPSGGKMLASPGKDRAPWEAGVNHKLLEVDSDGYAARVAGIQDSFNGRYPEALRQLNQAMRDGFRDPTVKAFGALAAFHQDDMKNAAKWAEGSLSKDPAGPWAKMSDSVLRLTRDKIAKAGQVRGAAGPGLERGADPLRGAVGPQLFPGNGPGPDGIAGKLRAALRALGVRDYPRAEELAAQVLGADPKNLQALRIRANAELHRGLYKPAFDDAERGLSDAPGDPAFLQTRALAAGRLGHYDQTLSSSLELLRADARDAAGLRLLAFAEAGRGDQAAMTEALKRAAGDLAAAELLRRAGQLPAGTDAMALFSDALLLGEGQAAQAGTSAAPILSGEAVKNVFLGFGMLLLTGLFAAGAWLAWSRRPAPAPAGASLDLSEFRRKTPASRPVTKSPAVPADVGPYRILGPLGKGGMGVIYKAKDTGLDRPVALKRMRDEIAEDPRERRRFLKEARIVSALDHPGIVRIYSVHEAPEGVYLVFEFVEGRTLAEIVAQKGPLSPADARTYTIQAAEAVAYAHSQGVVHRDLKPSNIMVDSRGRVRVMDFGVARAAKDAITRLTAQGAVTGTPAYMAPEQEDGKASPASDVYALGVCFYEMLTGKPPFAGSGLALYKAKREGRPRALAESLGAAAPQGLDAVLAKALHPDPSQRFSSPRDLAAALGAIPA